MTKELLKSKLPPPSNLSNIVFVPIICCTFINPRSLHLPISRFLPLHLNYHLMLIACVMGVVYGMLSLVSNVAWISCLLIMKILLEQYLVIIWKKRIQVLVINF